MADVLTVLGGVVTILGTLGGIVTTVAALRASGARHHIERAQGASAMLAALAQLPQQNGTRLVTTAQDDELRAELSRIVRENAASYVKRNPTPVGFDFPRVLMPAYVAFFGIVSVAAFIRAGNGGNWGDTAAGFIFAAAGVGALLVTAVLLERLARRNDARRLAGTPGREDYFGPLADICQTVSGAIRKRRAQRRAKALL